MGDWQHRLAGLGLADVFLDRFGLVVAVYGITRGLRVGADLGPIWLMVWLVACFLAFHRRWGLYVLAGVTLFFSQDLVVGSWSIHHNGIMLVAWLSLAAVLFTGSERLTALRAVTTTVYSFAALNKLFPTFLSGQVFVESAPWVPYPALLAPMVVLMEAGMAYAVWKRWRWALPAALAMHIGFVAGIHVDLETTLTLIDYNLMMVVLVGISTRAQRVTP